MKTGSMAFPCLWGRHTPRKRFFERCQGFHHMDMHTILSRWTCFASAISWQKHKTWRSSDIIEVTRQNSTKLMKGWHTYLWYRWLDWTMNLKRYGIDCGRGMERDGERWREKIEMEPVSTVCTAWYTWRILISFWCCRSAYIKSFTCRLKLASRYLWKITWCHVTSHDVRWLTCEPEEQRSVSRCIYPPLWWNDGTCHLPSDQILTPTQNEEYRKEDKRISSEKSFKFKVKPQHPKFSVRF